MRQYDVTMQQVEDAIERSNANVGGDILALGSQAHNVRVIGLLGGGVDPLDPANVAAGARDRGGEARRDQQDHRHGPRRGTRSSSGSWPR